jgi:hypothetical protein
MRHSIACIVASAWLLAAPSAHAEGPVVSSHAMIHTCCAPYELKERIFAESKAVGSSFIRVDFELGAIFHEEGSSPDWTQVDQVLELSRRYELPVLGIVLDTPQYLSTCPDLPSPERGRCPPTDLEEYGRITGELVARARGTISHWEILNEPDGGWAFFGSPQDYARMLSVTHDAIKARAPEARVVMGGIMNPWSPDWVEQVFATEGTEAARKFDIANVHLRGRAEDMPRGLNRWRNTMARHGFTGPIWVTEHDYSADPAYQGDPAYKGGEAEQAAYLQRSLRLLAGAGAEQIFVTIRDEGTADWAAVGLTHIEEQPPFAATRRQAFDAVRAFGEWWRMRPEWRARQQEHERLAAEAEAQAGTAELRAHDLAQRQATALAALGPARRRVELLRSCARTARAGRIACRSARRSCARRPRPARRRCLRRIAKQLSRQARKQAVRVRNAESSLRELDAGLQAERAAAERLRADARRHAELAGGYASQIQG